MVSTKSSNLENQAWYVDCGANTHITTRLDNLSNQQAYQGSELVLVGNGFSLPILHSNSSILYTLASSLTLKNVFHFPKAPVNPLSIQFLFIYLFIFNSLHPTFLSRIAK